MDNSVPGVGANLYYAEDDETPKMYSLNPIAPATTCIARTLTTRNEECADGCHEFLQLGLPNPVGRSVTVHHWAIAHRIDESVWCRIHQSCDEEGVKGGDSGRIGVQTGFSVELGCLDWGFSYFKTTTTDGTTGSQSNSDMIRKS
jgi:hypothetical protein